MTQQHDPDQPRTGYGRRAGGGMNWLPLALGAVAVVVAIMMFMPSRDTTAPDMTGTSTSGRAFRSGDATKQRADSSSPNYPAYAEVKTDRSPPYAGFLLPEPNMSVTAPRLPVERLVERAEMRLEQYRVWLRLTPGDRMTKEAVQRIEDRWPRFARHPPAVREGD